MHFLFGLTFCSCVSLPSSYHSFKNLHFRYNKVPGSSSLPVPVIAISQKGSRFLLVENGLWKPDLSAQSTLDAELPPLPGSQCLQEEHTCGQVRPVCEHSLTPAHGSVCLPVPPPLARVHVATSSPALAGFILRLPFPPPPPLLISISLF